MKTLHRSDLFGWSKFDEARDIDFNSVAWVRPGGNVLVDPLPLSAHDEAHLKKLGGAAWIVVTNSEHVRDAARLRELFGAKLAGPMGERATFPLPCDAWLANGEHVVPGLRVIALDGSKTPGELALVLEETTLITGDLIRAQRGGSLNLLPDAKLKDKAAALASVKKLAEQHARIEAVLVGDGWPVFRDGHARLKELAA
jgi:glyoxylase-like metal-dependent hydrolase (beta-lactamase superfamily II)